MEEKKLTLSQLSYEHPEYVEKASVWRNIKTLNEGYPTILQNLGKYLPRRPVEDDELYKLRTDKFSYTPVMGRILSTYLGKLISSGLSFPDMPNTVWDRVRTNNSAPNEAKRSEMSFLTEVFSSLLLYGTSIVTIDLPNNAFRSQYEVSKANLTPYFTVLSPLEVINWGDGWYVLKQYINKTEPFSAPEIHVVFTYVTTGKRVEYSIPSQLVQMYDSDNNLYENISKVKWKGEWLTPDDEVMSWAPTLVTVGAGLERIVKTILPEHRWLCRHLYNKQISHLRIENAWVDSGYLSGTVQRVFTPEAAQPNDDPRVTLSKPNIAKELAKAGNNHILVGKEYKFVESSGTALYSLEGMLNKIESQMKETANLHFASVDKGVLQQSAASKRVDMGLLEGALTGYGAMVLDIYNELMYKIADMFKIEPVLASGLNNFADKDITDITTAISVVSNITDFPAMGRSFLYRKLLEDMEIALTDADKVVLETQLALGNTDTFVNKAIL